MQGNLEGIPGVQHISREHILELDVDVLVPAAFENVIGKLNAHKIQARAIISMANGPVTEDANEYLTKKNILIMPDILANAGGVIVSYLEWYQNMHNEKWTEAKVNERLDHIISDSFGKVWIRAQKDNISIKNAAFTIALEKLK